MYMFPRTCLLQLSYHPLSGSTTQDATASASFPETLHFTAQHMVCDDGQALE